MKKESFWLTQILPLALTGVIFAGLSLVLFIMVKLTNHFVPGSDILINWHVSDILFGMLVYLKTSVDFAIFIGNLIRNNPGYKSRIAVEMSTALANALGTILILVLWTFFKELDWLLGIMVFIASLALARMAQDGLEHARKESVKLSGLHHFVTITEIILSKINQVFGPVLNRIIPKTSLSNIPKLSFWSLFAFAFTVPFILGLDNFAGYVPLFSVVKVFGFSIGVFLGHMILNILLYLSPSKTIKVVVNPIISLMGSLVFVGLAVYGFVESIKIFSRVF
ncbi:MAG TPA: hypothetical protein VL306_03380 [Methylomirabilota bacterium]|nr:hypothetical protein [Methylomirabilota bacterium]